MTGNYLKIATRNIVKHKLYSFINAFGLSIGIAFCMLIYLFILDEKSFDRFHSEGDRIYRIHATSYDRDKGAKGDPAPYSSHAYLPAKLGEVIAEELPEVEHMSRFKSGAQGTFRYKDKVFSERVASVDSGFFKMFDFRMLQGDPDKVFRNPTDAVITPAIAKKYFGDEDPIGKVFTFAFDKEETFTVAGVIEEPPANSSIQFQVLLPLTAQPYFSHNREQWGAFSYPTFVTLKQNVKKEQFKKGLDEIVTKYMATQLKRWRDNENVPKEHRVFEFDAMPLAEIHNTPTELTQLLSVTSLA